MSKKYKQSKKRNKKYKGIGNYLNGDTFLAQHNALCRVERIHEEYSIKLIEILESNFDYNFNKLNSALSTKFNKYIVYLYNIYKSNKEDPIIEVNAIMKDLFECPYDKKEMQHIIEEIYTYNYAIAEKFINDEVRAELEKHLPFIPAYMRPQFVKKYCHHFDDVVADYCNFINATAQDILYQNLVGIVTEINKLFSKKFVAVSRITYTKDYNLNVFQVDLIEYTDELESLETNVVSIDNHLEDNISYIDDYKDLNKLAMNNNYTMIRAKGSHGIFSNGKGNIIVIPQGRTIGKGLSLKIQKDILKSS